MPEVSVQLWFSHLILEDYWQVKLTTSISLLLAFHNGMVFGKPTAATVMGVDQKPEVSLSFKMYRHLIGSVGSVTDKGFVPLQRRGTRTSRTSLQVERSGAERKIS